MAKGFTIKLEGLESALKKLNAKKLEKDISAQLYAFAENVVRDAKQLAPVDESHLKQSIGYVKKPLEVEIVVNCDYAAYVEFGTRKFAAAYVATLPPDWQSFAAKFKGGGDGGSFMSFFYRILQWVQRKGLAGSYSVKSQRKLNNKTSVRNEYNAAYLIALSILRNGIHPQPFLYPAFEQNRLILMDSLKSYLQNRA